MKRFFGFVFVVAVGLVAACGGGSVATGSLQTPPTPVVKYKNTLPGLNATANVDLIQNVIDFQPGAASSVHIHSSPNLGTVIEGQITVKTPMGDKDAAAGQMLVEPINQPLQAVNTGSDETMVLVAFAVPHGKKPTAPVAGKPAPALPSKTLYSFSLPYQAMNGPYSLVQQVLDFTPGSQTSKFHNGGPGVITVLQGAVTVNVNGEQTTVGAGDSFTETQYQTQQVFNRGTADAVLVESFLLPDTAQLMSNS